MEQEFRSAIFMSRTQLSALTLLRVVIGCSTLAFGVLDLAEAQIANPSPTVININNTYYRSAAKRLGINLGGESFYGSGQITKNLIFRNPGFEGGTWQSILHCAAVTSNSCTDSDIAAVWPAGFFNGATAEFIYGANTGSTAKVIASTAASYPDNIGTTVTFDAVSQPLAVGDYVIVREQIPGNGQDGWWPSSTGGATFSTETTDLSPETPGVQALSINAAGVNQTATLTSYFDSTPNQSFLQLNGNYSVTFRAKAVGGNNQFNLSVYRQTTTGNKFYLNQTVTLSNVWQDYTYSFSAADSGVAGSLLLNFVAAGSAFYLDDVSVAQTSGSPTNTTAFRDEVVSTLASLNPGIIRYMDSGENWGSSLDNMLAVPFARTRPGYNPNSTESDQIPIGLHDFLVLCQTIGAEPWYTIQAGWSVQEMQNLMDYLGGSTATVYGAKRAALGQTAPWTSVFPIIHLEFGNEVWNTANAGALITDPVAYGTRAAAMFGAAKASPSYIPSKFDLVVDGWSAVPSFNQSVLANSSSYDTIDIAPYLFNSFNDDSSTEAIFGPMFAQPESFDSIPGGQVLQQVQTAATAAVPPNLAVYESNLSTTSGTVSQASVNAAVPSIGAGLTAVEHMLLMMRDDGILNQNLYSLTGSGNSFSNPNIPGEGTPLWGSVVDMGNTNRKRPDFLAMQLANGAIQPYVLQTTQSGLNPTWNQPLSSNDSIALSGAHYIQSFAFTDGTTNHLIVFNLSRTQALPVSFAGVNAPVGNVTVQTLTSANITDDNETSNVVVPSTTTETLTLGQTISLPPFSMTVFTSQAPSGLGTPTAPPTVTGVSVNCVAGSMTVSSTTSCSSAVMGSAGASTSGVVWTATAGSISSSGVFTAPATVPPGGNVTISAISAVSPSISGSYTVTIAPTGTPTIFSITSSVTPTTATVSWQTNTPSYNGVNYGTTKVLGQTTPFIPTLSTNASFTLTGLYPGTTYYLLLTSLSGNATGSYLLTLTTQGQPATVTSVAPTCLPGSILAGASAYCSAAVAGTGAYSSAVTWTAVSGTISPTGVYTAPATPPASGTDTITAASVQDPTKSATTSVSIVASNPGPPILSNVQVTNITQSSLTISWFTNQPTINRINYGTTPAYGLQTPFVSTQIQNPSITITGLTPSTTYYFQLLSGAFTSTYTSLGTYSGSANTSAPNAVASIAVNCAPTSVATSASASCVATVTGTGNYSSGVTWSASAGSVSPTGVFTAPASVPASGVATIAATSTQNSAVVGLTTVSITAPPPGVTSISVVCTPNSVLVGATSACSALVAGNGSYSSGVTWSAVFGTISSTGAYTAPANPPASGSDTITATSTQDPTKSGSTSIAVNAPAPVLSNITTSNLTSTSVTISWQTSQATYNRVSYGSTPAYGLESPFVNATTQTPSVTLTGLTPGTTYYFQLLSQAVTASYTSTGFATLSVTTPVVQSTILSVGDACTPLSVPTGGTSNCSAGVAGTGSYSSAVTWWASAGSISSTGVFTAPSTVPAGGTVTIIATSVQNPSFTGGTTVNIFSPVPATVTTVAAACSPISIVTSTTSTCSASVIGTGGFNPSVTWSASAGSIDPSSGVFTAPSNVPSGGMVTITATSVQNPAISGSTTVAIVSPGTPLIAGIATSLTPNSITVSWQTSVPTYSGVNYGPTTALGGNTPWVGVATTTPSFTLSGLNPGTLYYLQLASISSTGTALYTMTVTTPTTSSTVTSVGVVCSPASVATGATSACLASVAGTGSFSSAVSWSASAGTISSSGLFTAPTTVPASGYVTITAISSQNASAIGTANIAVSAPSTTVTSVSAACSPNSVGTGALSSCAANVAGTGAYSSAVTWSASAGSISSNGAFTAPATVPASGYVTITATSIQNPAIFGSTSIAITAPVVSVTSVSVTCATSSVATNSVATGASALCSATVAGTGSYSSAVTWSASAGSISAGGSFTAPSTVPASGYVTITATSTQNPAISGSTTIAITTPTSTVTSIAVNCSPNSIVAGATASCAATVSGTGGYSSAVTWSASGGNISSNGGFTAPSTIPGSGYVTITATSTQNPSIAGSTTVSIAAPGTPTISSVATNVSPTSITVSWQTNVPTYSGVNYGPTIALGGNTPWVGTASTSPTFTLSGLNPGTLYYLQLASISSTGTAFYTLTVSTPTGSSTVTSVSVNCSSYNVATGATSSCSANVGGTGSYSSGVIWSASAGSISPSGLFTAPTSVPASGYVTIIATSSQNAAIAGSANIAIATPSSTVTSVAVGCAPSSVSAGGTASCSSTVYGTGNYSSGVNWSASAGSISPGGVFTAPATAPGSGYVTITATSTQNPSVASSTNVAITSPSSSSVNAIAVYCGPAALNPGGTSTCGAQVFPGGNFSSAVIWSASVGTISSSGVYTAPGAAPASGSVTITATSTQNPSVTGTAVLSIAGAASAVTGVTPYCGPASISAGGTSSCSATVYGNGGYSSGVTWSASAGNIAANGAYTAPSAVPPGGSVTITATSTQNPAISGSTTIAVTGAAAPGIPNIYGVTSSSTGNSITVSWQTDVPTYSGIGYGSTPGLGGNTPWVGVASTNASFTLTGLNSGTLYYLQLTSIGSNGTAFYSFTVTTQ